MVSMKHWIVLGALFLPGMSVDAQEAFKGFPTEESAQNLKENFRSPPKGYGNVPFYWWNGDSLVRERLADQLDILAAAPTDGFSVSYIHTHPGADVEINANGYGSFGKADPGKPGVFTDGWWATWNWFANQCADRGIGLGLDDYVVGWEKNGYYVDEILSDDDFRNYKGRLKMEKHGVAPGETVSIKIAETPVSVMMYPSGKDLSLRIESGVLTATNETAEAQAVYVITALPSHELHPRYGDRMVECYFNRFNDRLDEKARQSLNYFFQDELHYGLNIRSWAEDMPEEFMKRKGYDVTPFLAAMFEYIGPVTPKIRLDYADVLTQLSEERFFKPVFDWHNDRGLIYGCDNNGRGLEPLEYLDYFRMTSWFTAPGNDAPARGSSFRQTKVSSSISHLYQRPRTWLEAFHSMGWDSNGEWLTSQLDHHVIAGGNLLCLHGLYYSTHGGWWEWAPPCFHFRMPYWPHMKKWLEYGERLCYLLSQGKHVCDIAILYPTETMQAYEGGQPQRMWQVSDLLSAKGLDYDFIDYHSLADAKIEDGELVVPDERYKVLILPDVRALHFATLQKVADFSRAGGIVISTDNALRATTLHGEDGSEIKEMWQSMFDVSSGRAQSPRRTLIAEPESIPEIISGLIVPDFTTTARKGTVLHRRIGDKDVYMVMNVDKNDEMFFRSKGQVELWNAKDGSVVPQPVVKQDVDGTWIKHEGESNVSSLYVFSPGNPIYNNVEEIEMELVSALALDGDWDVEIVPTMDNKWGDYRLPASEGKIGPEVREFATRYMGKRPFSGSVSSDLYGFGPLMEMAVIDKSESLEAFVSRKELMDETAMWTPYVFSWQYGVKDSPGSQGYHGLKGKLDNRFLILDRGAHQVFRTYMYALETGTYVAEKEGVEPDIILVDGDRMTQPKIRLKKGWHSLVLAYSDTPASGYRLADKTSSCMDDRLRSAVVFYPERHAVLKDNDPYGDIIATRWFGTEHLPYSAVKGMGAWEYRFDTAPGTVEMDFVVNGEILAATIDGRKLNAKDLAKKEHGRYRMSTGATDGKIHAVALTAVPERGYEGAAFFAETVRLTCGKGKMPARNWAELGALKYFSGGVRYVKSVHLNHLGQERIELDLGLVDATCEVVVNGHLVDVLLNTPYKVDITDFVSEGDNTVEVLVYSSLSNHYQSIPSAYRGEPRAGLLGPVVMNTYRRK